MHTIFIEKLRSYIVHNNPDLLIRLNADFSLTRYIEDKVYQVMPLADNLAMEGKPRFIIEELCMQQLTIDLRPSRFNYLRLIMEEEFLQTYIRYRDMGVLTYELMNLIDSCKPVFEKFGFTEENEDDVHLREAIIVVVSEYLKNS